MQMNVGFMDIFLLCRSFLLYTIDWSTLECDKYNNDLDILAQFPFSVKLNASPNEFYDNHKSVAELSNDGNTVQRIAIKNEKLVPSSLFCLSNLTSLQIESTPFENGRHYSLSELNDTKSAMFV